MTTAIGGTASKERFLEHGGRGPGRYDDVPPRPGLGAEHRSGGGREIHTVRRLNRAATRVNESSRPACSAFAVTRSAVAIAANRSIFSFDGPEAL
ncbi:hypothetical protein [Spirillospora sp. NPDC047279]|uniref:hypothetical protein n=1 Tax=Spirillospora sp. NPDC047279 TaxID=3155478 RepID=UPI0033C942D4